MYVCWDIRRVYMLGHKNCLFVGTLETWVNVCMLGHKTCLYVGTLDWGICWDIKLGYMLGHWTGVYVGTLNLGICWDIELGYIIIINVFFRTQ